MGSPESVNKKTTTIIFWVDIAVLCVIVLLLGMLIVATSPWRQKPLNESFSEFSSQVDRGVVSSVKINSRDLTMEGKFTNGTKFKSAFPATFDIAKFLKGKVKTIEVNPQNTSTLLIVIQILPLVLLSALIPTFIALTVLLIIYLPRSRQPG